MKISFDYDDTLSLHKIQEIAKSLIKSGHDVWIITTRNNEYGTYNHDMFYVAQNVGISLTNIIFTDGTLKAQYYKKCNFEMHFDNDWEEIEAINIVGGLGILVTDDMGDVFGEMQKRFNDD